MLRKLYEGFLTLKARFGGKQQTRVLNAGKERLAENLTRMYQLAETLPASPEKNGFIQALDTQKAAVEKLPGDAVQVGRMRCTVPGCDC